LDDIQLHLKRPAYLYPEDRLDRLLARKAAEGVQVFITLYKEVGGAVPLESYYTKCTLKRYGGRRQKAAMRRVTTRRTCRVYAIGHGAACIPTSTLCATRITAKWAARCSGRTTKRW